MTPATVLDFWFDPANRPRWFAPDPAFDAACADALGPLMEAAGRGELEGWRDTPEGALALVILLDQLPRNVGRGTARMYAFDSLALAAAKAAVERGFDRQVPPDRRLFFYLPFEHSEDLADQERAVELTATLDKAELLDYAVRHRDIVARFGRFPHRNAILGRPSTAEEIAFLETPGSSF